VATSTHKKIVYAGFGCAGVFIALGIVGLVFMRESGFNVGFQPRTVSPAQATAALAELRRADLAAPLPLPPPDDWQPDPRTLRGAGHVEFSSSRLDDVLVQFGDSFPEGSLRRTMWIGQAGFADVVMDATQPAAISKLPPDGLPTGAVLLALARRLVDRGHATDARVAIAAAIRVGRSLARNGDLREVAAGWRIQRDAAAMLAGSVALGGEVTQRAHARHFVSWADSVIPRLRELNTMIETAGATPGDVAGLADLLEDTRTLLATRRALLRAIAQGWAENPVEKTYGISAIRDSTLRRLLPDAIKADVTGGSTIDLVPSRLDYGERLRVGATIDRERARFAAP